MDLGSLIFAGGQGSATPPKGSAHLWGLQSIAGFTPYFGVLPMWGVGASQLPYLAAAETGGLQGC